MRKYIVFLTYIVLLGLIISCGNSNKKQTEETQTESNDNYKELKEVIFTLEEDLFSDFKLDSLKANEIIGKYVYFTNTFPKDSLSPEFLFKASEVAVSIGQYHNAINYLQRIESEYLNYNKYALVLYYTAVVYDTMMHNTIKAEEYYTRFIENYPEHYLAEDASALLLNLGKDDFEMIRAFEEQNK